MALQRGFMFDPGDPSVGIFGSEWMHEECPAWAANVTDHPDEPGEVIEQELATVRLNDMTIRTYWLLTCTDCVQQVIVSADDWSPTEEAYAAESQAEADAMAAEAWADAHQAQYDDDPSPYAGTYSEE